MKLNAITSILLNASSCQVEYNCLNEVKCGAWCLLQSCLGCKMFQFFYAIVLSEIQCNINCLRDVECVITRSVFDFLCMFKEYENAFCVCHQFACVHLLSLFKSISELCHQHFLWHQWL